MPFYHEIPPRVLVGILHTELTTIAWSFGLRNLILPPGSDFLPIAGQPYDMARNTICAAAIHNGFDYVFHFDSDVIPPRDAVMRLLAHRKSIISGIYHRRSPPHGIPVMLKNGQWLGGYPANTLLDVDLVGAGCLLLESTNTPFPPDSLPLKPESVFLSYDPIPVRIVLPWSYTYENILALQ